MAIELAPDNEQAQSVLTDSDILDCFRDTPPTNGNSYLVAVGRAIEAKVLERVAAGEPQA